MNRLHHNREHGRAKSSGEGDSLKNAPKHSITADADGAKSALMEADSYKKANRILGFINRDRSADHTAIVQCTERPLDWSQLEKNFLMKVALGVDDEINVVSVPITSLVHPLCVIPDYGGDGNSYVVVLPRRNWSRYFGNRIT